MGTENEHVVAREGGRRKEIGEEERLNVPTSSCKINDSRYERYRVGNREKNLYNIFV